jgi:hypothetical protein
MHVCVDPGSRLTSNPSRRFRAATIYVLPQHRHCDHPRTYGHTFLLTPPRSPGRAGAGWATAWCARAAWPTRSTRSSVGWSWTLPPKRRRTDCVMPPPPNSNSRVRVSRAPRLAARAPPSRHPPRSPPSPYPRSTSTISNTRPPCCGTSSKPTRCAFRGGSASSNRRRSTITHWSVCGDV